MTKRRLLDVETSECCFTLVISPSPNGEFTVRYWSVPKEGRAASSHPGVSGSLTDENQDDALYWTLARINSQYGPVKSIIENDLSTAKQHEIAFPSGHTTVN